MDIEIERSAYGPVTLGTLIKALQHRQLDDDGKPRSIRFDFGGLLPRAVDSYRGYYDHLAMGWETWEDVQKRKPPYSDGPTAVSILANLKNAVGETFTGYKGGEYRMDEDTPVWVANNGEAPGSGIVDVHSDGWQVVLLTDYFP